MKRRHKRKHCITLRERAAFTKCDSNCFLFRRCKARNVPVRDDWKVLHKRINQARRRSRRRRLVIKYLSKHLWQQHFLKKKPKQWAKETQEMIFAHPPLLDGTPVTMTWLTPDRTKHCITSEWQRFGRLGVGWAVWLAYDSVRNSPHSLDHLLWLMPLKLQGKTVDSHIHVILTLEGKCWRSLYFAVTPQ